MDKRMVAYFFPLLLATLWSAISHAAGLPSTDRVSFRVQVAREVQNDRVSVSLQAQAENRDAAALADEINRTMRWALQQAGAVDKVTSKSGNYRTYPVYDKNRIVRWRGAQLLQLESADVAALTRLIGTLQARLQVQSMQFSVSPAARVAVEDELIGEALKAFSQRASLIARNLNASGYTLLDVNIGNTGRLPVVPVRLDSGVRATAAAVAPPAVEQGSSRISVQVSGSIRLSRP